MKKFLLMAVIEETLSQLFRPLLPEETFILVAISFGAPLEDASEDGESLRLHFSHY